MLSGPSLLSGRVQPKHPGVLTRHAACVTAPVLHQGHAQGVVLWEEGVSWGRQPLPIPNTHKSNTWTTGRKDLGGQQHSQQCDLPCQKKDKCTCQKTHATQKCSVLEAVQLTFQSPTRVPGSTALHQEHRTSTTPTKVTTPGLAKVGLSTSAHLPYRSTHPGTHPGLNNHNVPRTVKFPL